MPVVTNFSIILQSYLKISPSRWTGHPFTFRCCSPRPDTSRMQYRQALPFLCMVVCSHDDLRSWYRFAPAISGKVRKIKNKKEEKGQCQTIISLGKKNKNGELGSVSFLHHHDSARSLVETRLASFLAFVCHEYTKDYLNLARQRPITSPWQTSSALNSEPSSVRYMSKYTR